MKRLASWLSAGVLGVSLFNYVFTGASLEKMTMLAVGIILTILTSEER